MVDICCIGHITRDKIVTPRSEKYLNGGTSFYFSHGIACLPPVSYKLVTALGCEDMNAVELMRNRGIEIDVLPSRHTVFFENCYGENMNNRKQRVLAKADPFKVKDLLDIDAKIIHLGSLLADDFGPKVIEYLSNKSVLSVDAQGFLRYVDGEKVYPCNWNNKEKVLSYVDILKVNEHEIETLTGNSDLKIAAKIIAKWGVKEVVITLGSYGSVIYRDGKFYEIPAYMPKELVDATGCGDTYSAGYLYMRNKDADIEEAGKFAAAMSTIKLEKFGPFSGTIEDIEKIIR